MTLMSYDASGLKQPFRWTGSVCQGEYMADHPTLMMIVFVVFAVSSLLSAQVVRSEEHTEECMCVKDQLQEAFSGRHCRVLFCTSLHMCFLHFLHECATPNPDGNRERCSFCTLFRWLTATQRFVDPCCGRRVWATWHDGPRFPVSPPHFCLARPACRGGVSCRRRRGAVSHRAYRAATTQRILCGIPNPAPLPWRELSGEWVGPASSP